MTSPSGKRYDVGGFQLHAYESGSGSPTVIFEPALGAFGYQWLHIQRAVAQHTHTISYDRAGQGWSDCNGRLVPIRHIFTIR